MVHSGCFITKTMKPRFTKTTHTLDGEGSRPWAVHEYKRLKRYVAVRPLTATNRGPGSSSNKPNLSFTRPGSTIHS
jgi:hypothetical protein